MNVKEIVEKLEEEINGENKEEIIEESETKLSQKIEELSNNENFFHLPLKNIFSVISKFDFQEFSENEKIIETIRTIVKNIINNHYEEKETILILQYLNTKTISFSRYEEIISILEIITNCPILVDFCHLYEEQNKSVEVDYEYELEQKEKEIRKLQEKVNNLYIELDIFMACKEGNLKSVQLLIEKGLVDKNITVKKKEQNYDLKFYEEDTPIHIASKYGHLPIVEYLIEKQNVDIDINGFEGKTPLHYACEEGHLQVVEYLISKGANIDEADYIGNSLIHLASKGGLLSIVQYLIEKQNVDKDIKGIDEKTPLHYACENGFLPIVEYLITKGANIEAKDNNGKTPLDLASNEGRIDVVKYLGSK